MFDRVIISSDDSRFIEFLPIVSQAWRKFFPEVKIPLAFLSEKRYDDPFINKLEQFVDHIVIFKPIERIPTPNQSKMIRHILAGYYQDKEVCMVEDIDTIPLQRNWFEEKTNSREKNTMLRVGSEVLGGIFADKIPISTMTAESHIWRKVINPGDMEYEDLMNSWRTPLGKTMDNKQDFGNEPDFFSDESLIQVLIKNSKTGETKVKRDVDIHSDWIDRSWWSINEEKLFRGEYICCNFLRPFLRHYSFFEPIIKYIYGKQINKTDYENFISR